MKIKPLTDNCARALAKRDAAVLGISPFNSYFSESRIAALAGWALKRFDAVYYYIPDGPSVHTLEALGYPPTRAARKARRQSTWLSNKIRRADAQAGGTNIEGRILNSALLDNDPVYQDLLREVHRRQDTDASLNIA